MAKKKSNKPAQQQDNPYRGKCPVCSAPLLSYQPEKGVASLKCVVGNEPHFVIPIKIFEEAWDDYEAKHINGEQLLQKLLGFNLAAAKPLMNGTWKVAS